MVTKRASRSEQFLQDVESSLVGGLELVSAQCKVEVKKTPLSFLVPSATV